MKTQLKRLLIFVLDQRLKGYDSEIDFMSCDLIWIRVWEKESYLSKLLVDTEFKPSEVKNWKQKVDETIKQIEEALS